MIFNTILFTVYSPMAANIVTYVVHVHLSLLTGTPVSAYIPLLDDVLCMGTLYLAGRLLLGL